MSSPQDSKHLSVGTKTVIMVIAVWGEWHTKMLLEACLPSLASPDNLPAFAAKHRCIMHLYTRKSEWQEIRHSPIFGEISKYVELVIDTDLIGRDVGTSASAHHEAWQQSTKKAIDDGCYIWNMLPDVAFSNGSIRYLADLLNDGHDSVMWFYPRVVSTSFIPEFTSKTFRDNHAISISSRQLVYLALKHLHPAVAAYGMKSEHFPVHSELLISVVPNQGIAARMLINIHNLYNPAKFTLNEMQLTTGDIRNVSINFITDSDYFMGISLAPLGKDSAWYRNAGSQSVIKTALWWLDFDGSANDFVASNQIRLHASDIDEAAWQAAEISMNVRLRKIAVAREGLRLARYLEDLDAGGISFLIFVAIANGAIYNAVGKADRFLILASRSTDYINLYLQNSGPDVRKSLSAFMKKHIYPIPDGYELNRMSQIPEAGLISRDGIPLNCTENADGTWTINGHEIKTEILHLFNQRILMQD